jgi:AhpD family alkylhydroperoxidase
MTSGEPLPKNQTDPVPDPVPVVTSPRVPPGGRRELGLIGWLFCKLVARVWGVPEFHLFTVLVQHKRMFWTWGPFSGLLLNFGRLRKHDTEVVILRVAHLRSCEYELQQHRRLALRRGVDADTQAKVFAWPRTDGLSGRQRALLTGVDELVADRNMTAESWRCLAGYLDRRQLIEFVTLVGQYDALAMTLDTLGVPMDYPD